MNDYVKITSVFERGRAIRPRGKTNYFESECNWVYIIYGGSVHYSDGDVSTDLMPDCIYVLPAGKPFSLENPPEGGPDHFYALIGCLPAIREFVRIPFDENEFAADAAELIGKYNKKKDISAVISLLESALGYVMTTQSDDDTLAKNVKLYIDENAKKFDINKTCEKFHYSRRYLDMKFKEKYGVTVNKYGTDRKFAFILREVLKKVPLDIICEETDYSCAANLCRDFKKHFGLTPIRYRQEKGQYITIVTRTETINKY